MRRGKREEWEREPLGEVFFLKMFKFIVVVGEVEEDENLIEKEEEAM